MVSLNDNKYKLINTLTWTTDSWVPSDEVMKEEGA